MTENTLRVNIPSSFVKSDLKFKTDRGSGEAKLFIGSSAKKEEFATFFNNYPLQPLCVIHKEALMDYLKRTELEFIAQKCGCYKNTNREYYNKVLKKVSEQDDVISFTIKEFDDGARIYIRPIKKDNDVFTLIREIALPKITDLCIQKQDQMFIFSLQINFDNVCQRDSLPKQESDDIPTPRILDKPYQRIFFGAPGTGKSFKLNQEAEECFGTRYERVTFHPNYMYGNFVGTFKPFPEATGEKYENGAEKKTIVYRYVPGPLMRLLVKALSHPENNYLLLIEEINRANTAAVFGDFFQLLDRNDDGTSEYAITTSEEVKQYLKDALKSLAPDRLAAVYALIGEDCEHLVLPSNLYIWATMNSADQGVMPMDTAFKRRWEFTYIGIDEALENPEIREAFAGYRFKITPDTVTLWNDFRTEVNHRLSECNIPEDKLLGPYFISKSILDSGDVDKITGTINNKVLMYLYEDAGKAHRKAIFVPEKSRTYSSLCRNFAENGNAVFQKPLEIRTWPLQTGITTAETPSAYDMDEVREDSHPGLTAADGLFSSDDKE